MIERFNAGHVRRTIRAVIGPDLPCWSDGSSIIVSCGEGPVGEQLGNEVLSLCLLPAAKSKSAILGSLKDIEEKKSRGIVDQTFVTIKRF